MEEKETGKQFPLASNENLSAMKTFNRITTPPALYKDLMYIEMISSSAKAIVSLKMQIINYCS